MANLLVAIALCYVLIKIPFWVLSAVRGGQRSLMGSMVKGLIAYKTFGMLGSLGKALTAGPKPDPNAPPDPYERLQTDRYGQYCLPLSGLKRVPPLGPGKKKPATVKKPKEGVQEALFNETATAPRKAALPPAPPPHAWRPAEVGEQHMLPIHPTFVPKPKSEEQPATPSLEDDPAQQAMVTRTGKTKKQARPPKSTRVVGPLSMGPDGQYPLPLVGRLARTGPEPSTPDSPEPEAHSEPPRAVGQRPLLDTKGQVHSAARARVRRARPTPPQLPEEYKGIRPNRDGEYRVPLAVTPVCPPARTRPPKPAGPMPEAPDSPATRVDDGQLALDIPTPAPDAGGHEADQPPREGPVPRIRENRRKP